MTQKVIVIVGPTAVGKTVLSIDIAKKYKGQIISGDSMQVYKNLDIGTAKITPDEMEDIKHYMIDILQVQQRFSVADFIDNCRKDIKEIANDDNIPIIFHHNTCYCCHPSTSSKSYDLFWLNTVLSFKDL